MAIFDYVWDKSELTKVVFNLHVDNIEKYLPIVNKCHPQDVQNFTVEVIGNECKESKFVAAEGTNTAIVLDFDIDNRLLYSKASMTISGVKGTSQSGYTKIYKPYVIEKFSY